MPIISMFFGVIIRMSKNANGQCELPCIHAQYQDHQALFSINKCSLEQGKFPSKQRKLVEAWMELHIDELMADWEFAINNEEIYKIDPLKL